MALPATLYTTQRAKLALSGGLCRVIKKSQWWTSARASVRRGLMQKGTDRRHDLGQAGALDRYARRERAEQARRQARVEHHEHAAIVGAPDQPSIGLLQPQPRQHVVVGVGAGAGRLPRRLAGAVEDVGARPRDAVEHDQA